MNYTDDVNGIIIGQFANPYEFWQNGNRLAKGYFIDDDSAVDWFKKQFPVEFKMGVEMRCFE